MIGSSNSEYLHSQLLISRPAPAHRARLARRVKLNLDSANLAAAFTPMSTPLMFTSNGLTFEPFHKATNIPYHTYFKF
jgi:hypothetical protein